MNDLAQNEWHRLFSAALNDAITDAEKQQLATLLMSSAEARQLWFLYHDNECSLAELKPLRVVASPAAKHTELSWRRVAAVAAACVTLLVGAGLLIHPKPQRTHPDIAASIRSTQQAIARLSYEPPSTLPAWISPTASILDQPRLPQSN